MARCRRQAGTTPWPTNSMRSSVRNAGLVTQLSNPDFEAGIPVVSTIKVSFVPVPVAASPCRALNEADVSCVVRRYRDGATLVELAREYGVHKRTIAGHLERQGVLRRVNKRQMTNEQVKQAAVMYTDHMSLSKIGVRFEVDGSVVANELRKLGVKMRRQGVRY